MPDYVNAPPGGGYGPPLLDFSTIGNLGGAYHEGNQQARTRALQGAFSGGLPKLPDGSLDIKTMTDTLAKLGGADAAMPLMQMQMQQQEGARAERNLREDGGNAPPPQAAPALATPPKQVIPPTGIPDGTPPQAAAPAPGTGGELNLTGPGKTITGISVEDAPLPPQKRVAQAAPTAPQLASPDNPAAPAMDPAVADRLERSSKNKRAYAAAVSATNPKVADVYLKQAEDEAGQAKVIREGLVKSQEPTGPMKEAAVARKPNESLPAYMARAKSMEKIAEEVGKAQGAAVGEVIEAGRSSHKRIQQLAIIGDALKQGEGNITTGPFAEIVLKGKQALDAAFNLGLAGVPEAEVAQKAGFGLATQAVKEISGRPSQMEFLRGLQNNPGLLLSQRGSMAMIDILTQTARHDAELARIAQRRENWENWQDVQDNYYKSHPIMSPFDKKRPLGLEDAKILEKAAAPTQQAAAEPKPTPKPAPAIGAVEMGHRFKGGDPADQKNWAKVVSPKDQGRVPGAGQQ